MDRNTCASWRNRAPPRQAVAARSKVSSVGSSKDFAYTDAVRRATYTGDAHLTGPQGDMTSPRIELFLKPSGDEVDRAEGYEAVTLRGSDGRKTVGTRLTYFGEEATGKQDRSAPLHRRCRASG